MRHLIVGLCILVLVRPVIAADEPQFGPVPFWVRPNVPAPIGERTEAAVKFLLNDQQFNFAPTGDEGYFETVVHIQSPQGLSAIGNVVLRWKPNTDVVTVHKLHILRGEQTIDVLASGSAFTVMQRESNLELAALDGVLTAALQIPGLQVGDSVNLAFTQKRSDPVLAGISEQVVDIWPVATLSRVHLRARWNQSTPIRWNASPALAGIRETRGDGVIEVTLDLDDLAPQQFPKGAPIRYRFNRQIEFSGSGSWSDISKRLAPLYAKAAVIAPQSPLHKEIARIRAVSSDRRMRAEAALSLVQDQVRYVFLGMNDGALVPATADLTWSRRFGDCKAKTSLLLAILRALDIKAEAVAVSSIYGDGLPSRLPMIGLFDHVLVRALIDDKPYWLDGTRTGDRSLEHLVAPAFHWGLPLAANVGELVPIVVAPLTRPLSETDLRIDATAGVFAPAPFRAETVLRGDLATAFKLQLGSLTPSERERGLREYWSAAYDFVSIDVVSSRYDEHAGEQRLIMEGKANLSWEKGWYETDGLKLGFRADFSRPAEQDQTAPFAVPFPVYGSARETILLPNSATMFSVDGDDIQRTVAGVEYARSLRIENGMFVGKTSSRSIAAEFPAAQAQDAQRALREMAADTVFLRLPKNYRWSDADVAAQRDKIYDSAWDYISRGNALLSRREYDRAIDDFDKAIALDAKADMAFADRGLAHVYKRSYEQASKDLDTAFELNPRNPVVSRARGILALGKRDAAKAVTEFTASLQLEPGDSFTLGQRAQAHFMSGNMERALADSAEAIRAWPANIDAYTLRFTILGRQGKAEQAIREVNQMLAANPTEQRAYLAAGGAYKYFKKDTEAARAFDRAVAISPSEAAYLTRASYRPRQDHEGKIADINAALSMNPRSTGALVLRATAQQDVGDYAKAIDSYNAAMEIAGDHYNLLTGRGIAQAKLGRQADAEIDFAAARAKTAASVELNNMCWSIAAADVALATALSICDEAISKSSAQPIPSFIDSRAFVLLRMGRQDDAIAAYDQALSMQPKLVASLYGRGIAKRRKGDVVAGDRDTQAALLLDPSIEDHFAAYGVTP